MTNQIRGLAVVLAILGLAACATYKARPLPFKAPSAYPNATQVEGATVAAKAYAKVKEAREAFGFDIRRAGMLPVQVIFDNRGAHTLEINPTQTFLEDSEGNLWPLLPRQTAYERAARYSQTRQIFKEGAYAGFLGATAGAIIGTAVGIVTGENVGAAAGKGAAVGAAAGATLGGAKGYASGDARRAIIEDLREKSLQNKAVQPQSLAYGFLFFPGEAPSARELRLQLREPDTGKVWVLNLNLQNEAKD